MKLLGFSVKSILARRVALSPSESGRSRDVEEQRQMRLETPGRPIIHFSKESQVQSTGIALIGQRRVGEPVTDYGHPSFERWSNDLQHMLTPRCENEQSLSFGCEGFLRTVEQNTTQLLRNRRSTRFSRLQDLMTLCRQETAQSSSLSGLSASLSTLQRDEKAG